MGTNCMHCLKIAILKESMLESFKPQAIEQLVWLVHRLKAALIGDVELEGGALSLNKQT